MPAVLGVQHLCLRQLAACISGYPAGASAAKQGRLSHGSLPSSNNSHRGQSASRPPVRAYS
eukprot:3333262-Alexandrium_andersonii.AAC.1